MNKQLVGREFILPEEVLKHLYSQLSQQTNDEEGMKRAKNLVNTGKVNYGQLNRILHDMKYMDKQKELPRYNLYGGDVFERWGTTILNNERSLIKNKKDSSQRADNMGAMNGLRQNSHLSKHTKKDNFNVPTNLMKSNSDKSSVSQISSVGIFEEITKIKKLINY